MSWCKLLGCATATGQLSSGKMSDRNNLQWPITAEIQQSLVKVKVVFI